MNSEDAPLIEEVDEIVEPAAGTTAKPEGADPDAPSGKGPAVVVDPAEFKRVSKELKAERARAKESEETARYWAERARAQPAQRVEEPEAEKIDDIDLVDIITTRGAEGLREVLSRMGFAKREELIAEVVATRGAERAEEVVLKKYPDLADNSSPLFKKTAEIWNQLKQDPDMARSQNLMMIAARTAAAELGLKADARGGPRRSPEVDEYDDYDDEDEIEHAERVGRQAGDRGVRPSRGNGQVEELSHMQKTLVRKLQDAGADIDEERYRKRAQAGVRIGGVPSRGARRSAPSREPAQFREAA